MKRTVQDLIVTALGMLTSGLTALVLALLDAKLGFAAYSFMLWFVLPVGALICGAVGASGYYFGARLFNHRPTRLFIFNVISVAVATYFLLYYLDYRLTVVEGQSISQAVPISTFLFWVLGHQSYTIAPATHFGISIGPLGYAVAVLQMLGFACGGFGVYLYLMTKPLCAHCGKYMKETAAILRIHPKVYDEDELIAAYHEVLGHLRQGNTSQASQVASSFGEAWKSGAMFRLVLFLSKCSNCPTESYALKAEKLQGKSFEVIPGLQAEGMFGPGAPDSPLLVSAQAQA
jgi:hypothetical protein